MLHCKFYSRRPKPFPNVPINAKLSRDPFTLSSRDRHTRHSLTLDYCLTDSSIDIDLISVHRHSTTVIQSYCHTVILSYCHTVILSYCHINFLNFINVMPPGTARDATFQSTALVRVNNATTEGLRHVSLAAVKFSDTSNDLVFTFRKRSPKNSWMSKMMRRAVRIVTIPLGKPR